MTITLLNGGQADTATIRFDSATYAFRSQLGADLTNLIKRSDKKLYWAGFDETVDNARISAGGVQAGTPLNTSTWSLFSQNMQQSVGGVGMALTTQKLMMYAAVALGIYFIFLEIRKGK